MENLKGSIKAFNVYHTDAYMIAVRNGFEGTEAEWLESLKGNPGYTPQKGIDYFDGEKGEKGDTGESGGNKNQLYYANTYKDNVTVLHKRNNEVGTSYQITIVNKEMFDGSSVQLSLEGTSASNKLGDTGNTNVPDFTKANDCLHAINAGIFLTDSGEADGITIMDGSILKSTGVEHLDNEQYVLGITEDGDMRTYINETAETILADGSIYAVTGFVPLIQNGVVVDKSVLAVCPVYDTRHPRQIIGILNDGNYFTFCCDGRTDGENGMTLAECIDTLCNDLSVLFAFNLDGGGSTQSVVGKKQINRVIDGRTVPNVLVFRSQEQNWIPNGVTALSYLQVNEGAYIDTGISETGVYSVEYMALNENWVAPRGHILSSTNIMHTFLKTDYTGEAKTICCYFKGTNPGDYTVAVEETDVYTIKDVYDGENVGVYLNGELLTTVAVGSTESESNTFYMFAYGGNPTQSTYWFTGKLYYLKMYDVDGNLVHYFSPVKLADGTCCLYDRVTGAYYNSTSDVSFDGA